MLEDFDLNLVRKQEADRRLKLLGNLIDYSLYDSVKFSDRAHRIHIPKRILWQWWVAYKNNGIEGLIPEWVEISQDSLDQIKQRFEQLGELTDTETVTKEMIVELGEKNGWTFRTAERWLARYRIGGLWGLAPENYSLYSQQKKNRRSSVRELATLSESELETVWQRRKILGDLVNKKRISNEEAQEQADKTGVSLRTIRNYLKAFRDHGPAGLAPKPRADKGASYNISERMVKIIEGIRLSKRDWTVRAVWEEACNKARALNELEPSEFQVRSICNNIPEPVKLIADGREGEFRNKYRITYRIRFENIVYQIDHTRVDVLVKDIRSPQYRTQSGEIRPWLTTCMDSQSHLVMAAKFGYDQPNRIVVATTIRDSLLVSNDKPYGGLPDEIWIDNGKDLVSKHVHQLTRELGIKLQRCLPHQPQHKGIVERFLQTLNTRLWARLPGYVNSNTVDRNPKAKAELTLSELVTVFWKFIEKYHHETHSQTGKTPLEYWAENCYAEPVDLRLLDLLLKEPKSRRVLKEGIKYNNRVFWDSSLKHVIGEDVLIRAEPSYMNPTEIVVYHGEQWLCNAIAIDSVKGQSIKRSQIAAAQRDQREDIKRQIQEVRGALANADRQTMVLPILLERRLQNLKNLINMTYQII